MRKNVRNLALENKFYMPITQAKVTNPQLDFKTYSYNFIKQGNVQNRKDNTSTNTLDQMIPYYMLQHAKYTNQEMILIP